MTIGSPSGSGATQNDIADGVGESDGRWMSLYDGGLGGSQPPQVFTAGSGATPSFDGGVVRLESSNAGDWGMIAAFSDNNHALDSGTILIKATMASGNPVGSMTNFRYVGVVSTSAATGDGSNNIAVFAPQNGDNTSGNVRVDRDGTDTDGSVSYPTIEKEFHSFAVLIDHAGNYISSGSTGFYIDSDPRRGDAANETLSAVPNLNAGDGRGGGIAFQSDGNFTDMFANHMEVSWRL